MNTAQRRLPDNGKPFVRRRRKATDLNARPPGYHKVFSTLHTQHTQMVEIYVQSFAPSLAHAALLRQYVATFPN